MGVLLLIKQQNALDGGKGHSLGEGFAASANPQPVVASSPVKSPQAVDRGVRDSKYVRRLIPCDLSCDSPQNHFPHLHVPLPRGQSHGNSQSRTFDRRDGTFTPYSDNQAHFGPTLIGELKDSSFSRTRLSLTPHAGKLTLSAVGCTFLVISGVLIASGVDPCLPLHPHRSLDS